MTRMQILAVLAVAPAAALAQVGALDAARGAHLVAADGNARVEHAADAALGGPAPLRGGEGELAPLDLGAMALEAGRDAVPAPDTYTIRPGDTLWDLSGRFLNNPWYWPKIWSYNPEIPNPHWIDVGNTLRFFPSADEAPARVAPVDALVALGAGPEVEEEELAPVRELEDFSRADMSAPVSIEEQEAVAVAGPNRIAYVPSRDRFVSHDTFITPRELEESGVIEAAFEEKLLLAPLDRAYARFGHAAPVRPGETYLIYKTERPIHHPVTNELFGYQSTVLGSARVVAVDDKAATLVISSANAEIERGARLGPWTQRLFRPVARRPNERDVDGLIIASPVGVLTQFAEHQVVFIDRGTAHGVMAGNVFNVVRSGDLYGRGSNEAAWDSTLPKETIGDLLVVDARENASAALITRSMKELLIGDRVEMRAAASASLGSGGY